MKVSFKMKKAIARIEKKYGPMEKEYFNNVDENCSVPGYWDGCELRWKSSLHFLVNHEGEIF